MTAVGLFTSDLYRGRTDYVYEIFGITRTSKRYARLGKLFMLCLTSGDFGRFFAQFNPTASTFHPPRGIQTTSITQHEEGKTDRSVMKVVAREPLKAGGFRLVYRADFRDDTWADCVAMWLKRWGEKKRG